MQEKGLPYVILAFAVFVYVLILLQLNRGTSFDEGYYLQGYLAEQPLHSGISQYHYIVRALFPFFPEDNVLFLRYLNVVLTLSSLLLLACSSYSWITGYLKLSINRTLYFSLIFLSGALGFSFASPVLYYDDIQVILYFLVCSILFLHPRMNRFMQSLSHVLAGFLFVFALCNYLSSGILLIVIYFLWSSIYTCKVKQIFFNALYVLAGLLGGLLIYHFFVHDVQVTYENIKGSFIIAQDGITGHDNKSLLAGMLTYFIRIISLFLFFAALGVLLIIMQDRIKNNKVKIGINIFIVLMFCVCLTQRKVFTFFYNDIFIIPIAFYSSVFIAGWKKHRLFFFNSDKGRVLIVLGLLMLMPVAGMFGTNQSLSAKAIMLLPFWLIAFFVLLKLFFVKKLYVAMVFMWGLLMFATYLHLGYFSRYHYYYSPQRSDVALENTFRLKNIRVSKQQKLFIERVNALLNAHGFQQGDKMLAFEVDLITVYAVGGIIPNDLFYGTYNMMDYYKSPPLQKIPYIMIYEGREKEFYDYLKKSDWNFPEGYVKYNLGKYAENMPETMESVLYIAREKTE